jgi:hypothetical protein
MYLIILLFTRVAVEINSERVYSKIHIYNVPSNFHLRQPWVHFDPPRANALVLQRHT